MAACVIRVAQDGSGDYQSVQDAIDAIPLCNKCRTIIRVSPGIYKQPIYVPKTKNLITLAGLSPEITVLTWNNTATKIEHHQAIFPLWNLSNSVFGLLEWVLLLIIGFGFWISGVSFDWYWDIWLWEHYCRRRRLYCRKYNFWELGSSGIVLI